MIATNRILPIALVAALLGGTVGAFVMRPKTTDTQTTTAATTPAETATTTTANQTPAVDNQQTTATMTPEQLAYRDGFEQGFLAAQQKGSTLADYRVNAAPVVNRSSSRRASNGTSRNAYYDYNQPQPQKRSFWQKHRDKLTVAAGTGGGALVGGLIGGKKGALIGGLAGAGGSALYTYKLRKRNNRR